MPQSYKIFINDKPVLLLNDKQNIQNAYLQLDPLFLAEPRVFLENADFWETSPGFYLVCDDLEKDFKLFKSNLKLIYAAGGLVWNPKGQLLMIYRRGFWDLPKGKVDAGESLEEAALREVEEETGMGNLELRSKLSITYHIYFQKKWILKETHWYEMCGASDQKLIPQAEEDILEAIWVAKADIPAKLTQSYSSIREILTKLLS